MKHKVKVTVIDKKRYPELQEQYCADPNAGRVPVIMWEMGFSLRETTKTIIFGTEV